MACGLLAGWFSWLKPGERLHLEVPDFQRTALRILNPVGSVRRRMVAERHLYGSHEAGWAIHCEGYTPEILRMMVESFFYNKLVIRRNSWNGTFNFELIAARSHQEVSKKELEMHAESYLKNFLLEESGSELKLLDVWMEIFRHQIDKIWA
jgi:hypothetical protein